MSFLTDIVWFVFKLSFGLSSLATVWATAVLKNGVLWAYDSEDEKKEWATGKLHMSRVRCIADVYSPGEVLEP